MSNRTTTGITALEPRRALALHRQAAGKPVGPMPGLHMEHEASPGTKRWLTVGIVVIVMLCSGFLVHGLFRLVEQKLMFPAGAACFRESGKRMKHMVRTFTVPQQSGSTNLHKVSPLRYYCSRKPGAIGSVIVFHGNAGTAADRVSLIPQMRALELNTFLVEYPGYAADPSGSAPSETTIKENALNLFDHLLKTEHVLPDRPVLVFGRSLGTTVATWVASKRPKAVHSLFLVSPLTCVADVVGQRIPVVPFRLLLQSNFPAHHWARQVICPVTIVHGSQDAIVPIDIGRKQANNFLVKPRFITIDNAGHNDIHHTSSALFWKAAASAFDDAVSFAAS